MADEQAGLEFDRLIGVGPQLQTAPTNAPATLNDLGAEFDRLVGANAPPAEVSATPRMDLTQLEGRRNEAGELIPIDQVSGIPVGSYWEIAKQSDPEAKAQRLQQLYPDSKVRILDSGDVTLELLDSKTGKPKDVIINPSRLDAHDLLDLRAQAPEIFAGLATALATQGRGVLRTTAQILLSSLVTGATGAARDVAMRGMHGLDVRPGDIAKERGAQTLFDMGAQTGLGVAGKATRALSPFAREATPGSLAFNLREGTDFLKQNYDIDLALTPGQRTGNTSLLAIEAAETPMPGSRSVVGKIKAANEAKLQELQGQALGRVLPDEELGTQMIGTLRRDVVAPLEQAVAQAREQAIAKGDKRIVDLLDDALGTPRGARVTPSQAGEATLKSFDERMVQAQEAVDVAYAKVNELPGGKGNVLSGSPAADAAAEIRKELPNVLKQVEKPTGLVDEFGKPMTREVEQEQVLASGVPEGLLKALTDLESLRGGKVSLQTLTNMKKAAYDAIAAFRTAHGDVKDRWFSKIATAYERGIQEGIDATSNLDLKDALAKARDTYKKELVPFERAGIKELAKDEFDAGRLSPEQVMTRLFEGPKAVENFKLLKSTLGANDPSFRVLKRAWGDTLLADVTDPVLGTLDAAALSKRLHTLATDRPELAQELLGKQFRPLMEATKLRGAIDKFESLDESALRTLFNLQDVTAADFRQLVQMSRLRDSAYVNGLVKDVADGVPLNDFKPTQFVAKLRNAKTPTDHVKQVLDALPAEQREAVATAELYRLLSEASVAEGETAVRALRGQPTNLSATKLVKAYGSGEEGKRTTMLLGEGLAAPGAKPPRVGETGASRVDVVEALVKTLAPAEATKTAFHSLGGLRQGVAVAQLMHGPFQYAGNFAKNMFLASAYMKWGGKLLTNTAFDAEGSAAMANAMIASEPFLRATTDAFGADFAQQMVGELKQSIDRFVFQANEAPAGRRAQATQRFLQGGQQPMRMEAQ